MSDTLESSTLSSTSEDTGNKFAKLKDVKNVVDRTNELKGDLVDIKDFAIELSNTFKSNIIGEGKSYIFSNFNNLARIKNATNANRALIVGKNLLDSSDINTQFSNVNLISNDGCIKIDGVKSGSSNLYNLRTQTIVLKANQPYVLSSECVSGGATFRAIFRLLDDSNNVLYYVNAKEGETNSVKFTPTEDKVISYLGITLAQDNAVYTDFTVKLQLEYGETKTVFEKYESQIISVFESDYFFTENKSVYFLNESVPIDTTFEIECRNNCYSTPEGYGAVGDGITDDTEAIQKAINSSNIVLFNNNATYKIDGTITINKQTSLIGCGSNIYAPSSEYVRCVFLVNASCYITGFNAYSEKDMELVVGHTKYTGYYSSNIFLFSLNASDIIIKNITTKNLASTIQAHNQTSILHRNWFIQNIDDVDCCFGIFLNYCRNVHLTSIKSTVSSTVNSLSHNLYICKNCHDIFVDNSTFDNDLSSEDIFIPINIFPSENVQGISNTNITITNIHCRTNSCGSIFSVGASENVHIFDSTLEANNKQCGLIYCGSLEMNGVIVSHCSIKCGGYNGEDNGLVYSKCELSNLTIENCGIKFIGKSFIDRISDIEISDCNIVMNENETFDYCRFVSLYGDNIPQRIVKLFRNMIVCKNPRFIEYVNSDQSKITAKINVGWNNIVNTAKSPTNKITGNASNVDIFDYFNFYVNIINQSSIVERVESNNLYQNDL